MTAIGRKKNEIDYLERAGFHLLDELSLLLLLEKLLFLRASTLHYVFNVALSYGIQMSVLLSSFQFCAAFLLFSSPLLFSASLPVQNALLFKSRVLHQQR